ncbi:MAG: hypothetical protein A2W05_05685 [Candidatus Schekmanbacteria bacterium RBG_16_38_10]|uniref:Uncharacterized protein n=1 Tax=Candidatus Schekmanbacteria bacterium RBG_16_38_10 TaxID=1817879 RepID=A0A1F7S0S6_9BACT|nr:MAG: hypothetical protein A2W05_05685 [Candidatus Schekmanbacteria bacterium RBG_16_38_10]
MTTTRWLGYVQGTNRGKAFVRMKISNAALTGDFFFKDVIYGTAAAKIKGRLNDSQITANLFDFVFAKPLPLEPQTGQISMTIAEDNSEISGAWATDIGTHGQCHLFKINFFRVMPIFVPLLYRIFLLIKRGLIANLKYLYLVFSLLVMITSATSVLKEKIGLTETIILIIPLIFLFRNEIKNFFIITGLKKIGPVEFQEQSIVPLGINQETISRFVQEYAELFPLFVYLNQFFVPRTKALLRILATGPSITRETFDQYARMLGIEENNIQVTYDVLLNRCLQIDPNGLIGVTEIGRRFLEFESRFNQLFPLR